MDEGSLLGDSQDDDDDMSEGEAENLLREDSVSLHPHDSSLMDEEDPDPRSWRSEVNPQARVTRSVAQRLAHEPTPPQNTRAPSQVAPTLTVTQGTAPLHASTGSTVDPGATPAPSGPSKKKKRKRPRSSSIGAKGKKKAKPDKDKPTAESKVDCYFSWSGAKYPCGVGQTLANSSKIPHLRFHYQAFRLKFRCPICLVSLSPDLGVGTKNHWEMHSQCKNDATLQDLHVLNLVPEAWVGSKEYGGEHIQVNADFVFNEIASTRPLFTKTSWCRKTVAEALVLEQLLSWCLLGYPTMNIEYWSIPLDVAENLTNFLQGQSLAPWKWAPLAEFRHPYLPKCTSELKTPDVVFPKGSLIPKGTRVHLKGIFDSQVARWTIAKRPSLDELRWQPPAEDDTASQSSKTPRERGRKADRTYVNPDINLPFPRPVKQWGRDQEAVEPGFVESLP
jgi:hypothetical protein